jgi:hypothetical protein
VELRGVREGELRGLFGHSTADFGNAVPDADYRGLPRRIEKTASALIDDPAAFAAHSNGIVFAKIPRERCGAIRHAWRRNCNRADVRQGRARDPILLQKSSLNTSQRKVMLCLRGFRVEERLAMNKRMGRASFLKLLLVFFVAAHPLPAQEAHKAIRIEVDLREAPKRIYHAKMEFPVAAGPNRAEPLQPAASLSSC